ncbi:cell death abnormality protein 1-like isoform X2 [Haliotis rufescens]|uniref:cell death abnormality protein 1-like isoform X2 n=1 Tax=Haliotis rufescens TaxID=6454 RepID=UPI00201F94BE|nr:cell death abnormality protein 1-like isoform X2 [Haliotis rufescens]
MCSGNNCTCQEGFRGVLCTETCVNCKSCNGAYCTCQEGFRGALCTETCVNCKSCIGAYCICQEGFRGVLCTETCVNCQSCNGDSCTCKAGFHGDGCTAPCPLHCLYNVCGLEGECTRGCELGWYGRLCKQQCNNCVNGSCSLNGICTSGCSSGWSGDKCDEACNVNCEDELCYRNGTCETCKPGFHGDQCNIPCSSHCSNQRCDRSGACESCRVGNFGEMCERHCGSNCMNHACEQMSGRCINGCTTGWYGDTCHLECPDQCASESCHKETGSCKSCMQGFKGSHCNASCPQFCSKCEQYSEACLSCEQKHFGKMCDKLCSSGCNGGTCHHQTGICSQGCIGTSYGHYCNNSCSDHCVNRNCHTVNTDVDTPQCTEGCEDGWWGDYCDNTCLQHCVRCDRHHGQCLECEANRYGESCNLTCNTACLKSQCNMTGVCINGCEDGRYGSQCSERCPTMCNTCLYDGACLTCADGWTGEHCNEPRRNPTQLLWVVIPCLLIASLVIMAAVVLGSNVRHSKTVKRLGRPRSSSLVCILNPSYEESPRGSTTPVDLEPLDPVEDAVMSPCVDTRTRAGQGYPHSHSLASGHVTDTAIPDWVWSTEVTVQNLGQYVGKMKDEGGFTSQFYNLPSGKLGSCTQAGWPENAFKNRYRNILPYDHSRVKLSHVPSIPGSDFINANWINGYGEPRAFVATQGPYAAVMWDFWRMIWETDASKVIMLTNFVENRKAKCEKYWPDFGYQGSNYDDVHVQCLAEEEMTDYTVRTFSIHMEGQSARTLTQFHFTAWPDKGVPRGVGSLVEFYRLVRNSPSTSHGPMVVHCSAGVGRTGTFIALDYLIAQAKAEGAVDVCECIVKLRHQRMDLIQTEAQYTYLHDALIEALPTCDRMRSTRGYL